MRVRPVVITSALLGLLACGGFGGNDGEREAPADAGAPAKDAGGKGPTSDGAATDAPDLTTEAGVDERFADVVYDHTDDFERPDIPAGGPFGWVKQQGGANNVQTETCVDALVCSLTHVAAFENQFPYDFGHLETALKPDTRIVRLDFSMMFTLSELQPDTSPQVQIASFELEDERYLILERFEDSLRLGDQIRNSDAPSDSNTNLIDIATANPGEWARYRLYVDLDAGVMALARNGVKLPTERKLRRAAITTKLKNARIGITFAANAIFRLRFDDVGIKEWPARN